MATKLIDERWLTMLIAAKRLQDRLYQFPGLPFQMQMMREFRDSWTCQLVTGTSPRYHWNTSGPYQVSLTLPQVSCAIEGGEDGEGCRSGGDSQCLCPGKCTGTYSQSLQTKDGRKFGRWVCFQKIQWRACVLALFERTSYPFLSHNPQSSHNNPRLPSNIFRNSRCITGAGGSDLAASHPQHSLWWCPRGRGDLWHWMVLWLEWHGRDRHLFPRAAEVSAASLCASDLPGRL